MNIIDNNGFTKEFNKLNPIKKRFLMQWVAQMEMEVSDGKKVSEVAKDTFLSVKSVLPEADVKYNTFIPVLENTWGFGKDLKEWENGNYKSTGTDNTGNVVISDHASKRIRQRLGVGKKGQQKLVKKAYENGISESTAKGVLKSYFSYVMDKSNKGTTIRIYNDKVYLFGPLESDEKRKILVTVIPLPTKYRAEYKNAIKAV